jgi:hypothetical protein
LFKEGRRRCDYPTIWIPTELFFVGDGEKWIRKIVAMVAFARVAH